MASVSADALVQLMPLKKTAMAKAATWPSDTLPVGQAVDQKRDLLARKRVAVALLADDLLREEGISRLAPRVARIKSHVARAAAASGCASFAPPSGAMSLVSSCDSSAPVMPAAKLVMTEQAAPAGRGSGRG